jgi:hypothetical protein
MDKSELRPEDVPRRNGPARTVASENVHRASIGQSPLKNKIRALATLRPGQRPRPRKTPFDDERTYEFIILYTPEHAHIYNGKCFWVSMDIAFIKR